jgi:restriction system protein
VDIIAGRGAMGFDPPFLCVQVKSTESPVDVGVLRELQGTMKNYSARQGLLVSWGGFKSSVIREAPRQFFEIRLWDADDLIRAIMDNYERFSGDIQAELPVKRIWVLVPEE